MPVALYTFTAVALLVVSTVLTRSVSGDGDAEVLRSIYENSTAVTLSGLALAASFLLLLAPLVYLFRATEARSERVRAQLIGLVVATPIFLAGSAALTAVGTGNAADEFVAGQSSPELSPKEAGGECRADRSDDAAAFRDEYGTGRAALVACQKTELEDDAAATAVADQSATSISFGLGLGGRLGLAFALLYIGLWAMRTGLLTRFWGSLGMAMGVAALLLLIQLTFAWFLYLGLLIAGWVPGGKPPAWASGEAEPWPTPGEKAATELEREPAEGETPR
jgi:hypothetical protein